MKSIDYAWLMHCVTVNIYGFSRTSRLHAGLAWFYRLYEEKLSVELRGNYAQAEQEGRAARLGLWRDVEPVAPWVWGHRLKN